ncbi:MAG: beta-lactamase family protein [Propionibacteriaceae bacterium]|jgi:CubicO group peptidase (beta-lactamase class C family)|nr:beta-lactamase family protein [Propionibacteriaceae bacterium]
MLKQSVFDQFRLTNLEKNLGVYGVHVYQEGEGEIELRFRADDRLQCWSTSKTFTSLGVGMCADEGRLTLDDTVLSFFPEFESKAAPGSEAITVKNLLQMQPGKDYPFFEETDETVMDTTDWAELFFAGTMTSTPGTKFYYANGGSYMLARIVEAVSGLTLRDYLMPRLFGPLKILNPWWNTDSRGHSLGGYGLQLKTSELAKLGRLLLQEGEWEGKQLVSPSYIQAMHTDTVEQNGHFPDPESNAGYGYQVWLNVEGGYRADGMYGQYSIVIPDKCAVITTTAHNELDQASIIRAVFTDIASRL